jgi:transposase
MTERRGRDLEQWMTAAAASGEPALQSFVTGLCADQDAVTAGLTLPWSSGSVSTFAVMRLGSPRPGGWR